MMAKIKIKFDIFFVMDKVIREQVHLQETWTARLQKHISCDKIEILDLNFTD